MRTFTTHLQTMILMVLFAFATVQKANASAKAGEASVYEGSTVTIALADAYKRTLMQSTGVTYQWYSENNSYATVTSSTRYNALSRESRQLLRARCILNTATSLMASIAPWTSITLSP